MPFKANFHHSFDFVFSTKFFSRNTTEHKLTGPFEMHVKVVAEVASTIFNFRSFIRFSLRKSLPCSFTVPRHNFRITFWTKDEEKGEKKAKKRRKIQSSVRQFWGGLNCKSNRIELNELLPVHYQQQLLAIKIGCYWCSTGSAKCPPQSVGATQK